MTTPFDPDSPEFGLLDESQCLCGKSRLIDSQFCQECEDEFKETIDEFVDKEND